MGTDYEKQSIELAEAKRREIIQTEKYLLEELNYKHHLGAIYTSRPLDNLIKQSLNYSTFSYP
nr:6625_t:CDS:2 [Entrophospora candida]